MNLKRVSFLLVIIIGSFHAKAQAQAQTQTQTQINELDLLRIRPDSNSLKQPKEILNPRPVGIAKNSLDLKVDYWRHWTSFGVNANQAAFSDNWNGGGVNSISLGLLFNHKADYTKNTTNFVSEVDLKYGKIKNQDQSARKSTDRIFWDNKLSLKISRSWSLFTSVTFESQFDQGFKYEKTKDGTNSDSLILISNFMAPGYLTESLGLEFKRDKTFSLRIGTGTARQTFIADSRLVPTEATGPRFGVPVGSNFKNDLAFQLTANWDKNINENLNVKGRYNLFANYKDITDPSHRLDLTLTTRVTKLINVTFNGVVIYDSTIDRNIQASQTLALGLLFKLPN